MIRIDKLISWVVCAAKQNMQLHRNPVSIYTILTHKKCSFNHIRIMKGKLFLRVTNFGYFQKFLKPIANMVYDIYKIIFIHFFRPFFLEH